MDGKKEFLDFFKSDAANSMGRLITFSCGVGALTATLAATVTFFTGDLTFEVTALVVGLWTAALGGKAMSKHAESKKN
tara:strand:- start:12971 stop:13204 length:234 start_codon:yes stop_codon:yes gene_type:complete